MKDEHVNDEHVKDAAQDVAEDVLGAAEDGPSSVSGGKIIITPAAGAFIFLWFSRSLCFLFHLLLCANARRSRTQPGRVFTCVGGGHGAR